MEIYDKKVTCLNCDEKFKSKAVGISSTRIEKTDSDGCNHYSGKANPYLYQVFACPHCGFVFTPSFFMTNADKEIVRKAFLNKLSVVENYCEERGIEEAINVWKLGLVSAQIASQKTETMSGIALRIAWLYRYLGDEDNEKIFLEMAKNGYSKAYRNEKLLNTEANVINIMFQACIKLKDAEEARIWLNELYKLRLTDLIIDAKEQYDELRKTLERKIA